MDRWLLNTLPTWAIVILVVGGAVVIAVGGFLLMRRFVPSLAANADSRSLSSAFGMATGLFSFVLAFTIGQLYGNFTRATADAKNEAAIVSQVMRTSDGVPDLRNTIRADAIDYAIEVRTHEWKAMQSGKATARAWDDIGALYGVVESHRAADAANPYYSQLLQRLNDLVVARRTRLDDANVALPVVFQVMLVFGAVLALSTTFYFKPFGERIQIAMIAAAAVLVGTAMLVALMLDYPYSGSIAVSSTPFNTQSILLLANL